MSRANLPVADGGQNRYGKVGGRVRAPSLVKTANSRPSAHAHTLACACLTLSVRPARLHPESNMSGQISYIVDRTVQRSRALRQGALLLCRAPSSFPKVRSLRGTQSDSIACDFARSFGVYTRPPVLCAKQPRRSDVEFLGEYGDVCIVPRQSCSWGVQDDGE
jgi:hypothetical protein